MLGALQVVLLGKHIIEIAKGQQSVGMLLKGGRLDDKASPGIQGSGMKGFCGVGSSTEINGEPLSSKAP